MTGIVDTSMLLYPLGSRQAQGRQEQTIIFDDTPHFEGSAPVSRLRFTPHHRG